MTTKHVSAAIITRTSASGASSATQTVSSSAPEGTFAGSSASHSATEILATQRGHGEYKDWWEFPGGKIEPGETAAEALIREIREELDAEVTIDEHFCHVSYDYPDFHLEMDCFLCHIEKGEPTFLEHEASKWLRPEEYGSLKWLGADIEVLEKLKARFGEGGSGGPEKAAEAR